MTLGRSLNFDDSTSLRRWDPVLIGLWIALVVIAVIWLAPFAFIILTSLKSNAAVMGTDPFAIPPNLAPDNYSRAWVRGNFSTTFLNSVIITVIKVPLGLLISSAAAYALTCMKVPAGRVIFTILIMGTMLPFQVMLAPLFSLVNGLGLLNTYAGAILPYLAFGIPYQVFILNGFFRQVPQEISEAAVVDGASHVTIFFRIYLPISIPVLTALLIIDFVATWNEFAMALVILQDSR